MSDWLMAMGWDPIRVLGSKDRLPHGEGGEEEKGEKKHTDMRI